jgi:hypothetical protein
MDGLSFLARDDRHRSEDFNIIVEKFVEKPELTPVTFC